MKKIKFLPTTKMADLLESMPSPATTKTPTWYKNTKKYTNGKNDIISSINLSNSSNGQRSDATLKSCIPFIDSLTAGYMVNLPASIVVSNNQMGSSDPNIEWAVDFAIVDSQNISLLGNYPIPEGYQLVSFRWIVNWKIETPKGYSLWITHPSHRNDLPFVTLNGFVDTDKHPNALFLPFFIKKGFQGIIEKDTPIAQIIPIKRDSWESEKGEYFENIEGLNKIKQYFHRGYKRLYWSKKIYR